MTKIKDLIAELETRNPEAQVFMMTTRKQPYVEPRVMRSTRSGFFSDFLRLT